MDKLHVLFLCTGNSCRSQIAEGWARYLKGDALAAYSAGAETHGLNGFDDPPKLSADAQTEEESLSHYRRVRDEIRAFVEMLPEALTAANALTFQLQNLP